MAVLGPPLILASASPRRRALLEAAGLRIKVMPAHADETWPGHLPFEEAILEVVRRKLLHVPVTAPRGLAADTVVSIDGEILGKPESAAQACVMLARLSARRHRVSTGFVLRAAATGEHLWEHAEVVHTEVTFRRLDQTAIAQYVACGESLDKAGGYGIQSQGSSLVQTVHGSYTNIVGLPLPEVLLALERAPLAHGSAG